MENYVGRIVILVDDYEEALTFYEKNFGFKKLFDVKTDVGQRFLHIGSSQPEAIGIWFLKAENKQEKASVGNQTQGQPLMVIYTNALAELYEKLKNNGVTIKIEPVKTPEYHFLHCFDLYGNEIVVTELKS